MAIEIIPSRESLAGNPGATSLVQVLEAAADDLGIDDAFVYVDFPVYRDVDGVLVVPQLLLLSPTHGVTIFGLTTSARPREDEFSSLAAKVEHELQNVYSRLLPSKVLPKSKLQLLVPVTAAIYAPHLKADVDAADTEVLVSGADVKRFLARIAEDTQPLTPDHITEIQAIVDGTKGLRTPKKRDLTSLPKTSKGALAELLEAEIATLDHKQKHGAMVSVQGAQRIRGIAGSGKTVVLAMKAALAQVQYPEARILYTFHTRSLYQHIRFLITRAYRNRDYHDPNWDLLHVLHSWGGRAAAGVYFNACEQAAVRPLTFTEASIGAGSDGDAFEYACANLLNTGRVKPYYDFTFIDEGQDFKPAFLQLCEALTKQEKLVVAYDELQTIFHAATPTAAQMFGTDGQGHPRVEFHEDVVLHKCYRNPRQILVCAHAIGLGIYGPSIAQMPENEAHWNDLGYEIVSGELKAGSIVAVTRPEENSPNTISKTEDVKDIIRAYAFKTIDDEVAFVAGSVEADLKEGLRPDDIMVACLDSRHATVYMQRLSTALRERGIRAHDVHGMRAATGDFSIEGQVTLTTISKAKGNEAYVVYLVGIDAVWGPKPIVRHRNLVFTGLTRAKGWVRVTGLGDHAVAFENELAKALAKYPNLEFTYPSAGQIKVMKRDLEAAAAAKVELERLFDQFTVEEIEKMLKTKKAKTPRIKPKA